MQAKNTEPENLLRALIIDDEVQIRRLLKITLDSHHYRVMEAENGKMGIQQAASFHPHFILLDLGLPDISGFEVLTRIRDWSKVPILVLSVRNDEEAIVQALDQGADDYIVKPFNVNELLARMRVLQRRTELPSDNPIFESGALRVDLSNRIVTLKQEAVKLTATEFDLLACFVRHAGKVLTHRQILKEVWGPNASSQTQYLRVYVQHLRQKIEEDPAFPKNLITEPGVGYRFAMA